MEANIKTTRRLPQLRNQAQEQLNEARTALSQLPRVLASDETTEILELITEFCQEFLRTVDGTSEILSGIEGSEHSTCCGKEFVRSNRAIYAEFKQKIRATAPDFRPFVNHAYYCHPGFGSPDSEQYVSEEGRGNGPRDFTYVRKVIRESVMHFPFLPKIN